MSIDNIETRILAAKNKTSYPVIREDGQTPLAPPKVAGKGQVDSTVPAPTPEQQVAARAAERSGVVDTITMPSNEPDPASIITLGDTVVFPNPIAGTWEGNFTRGGNDPYVVEVAGQRVSSTEALGAVYTALREQAKAKGKK